MSQPDKTTIKLSYPLLLILTILAMLGGIMGGDNITIWPMIAIWSVLFLAAAGAHRRTQHWTVEVISELFCGIVLIHSCGLAVQNPAQLPAALLSFAAVTYLASAKMKERRQ